MRLNLTVTEETAEKLKILAGSPRRLGVMVDKLVADAFDKEDEVAALHERLDTLEIVVASILTGGEDG